MGPGILPETTVGKHNPPCHLQMPNKALLCKRNPCVNMVQKRHLVLWDKVHLKWTVSKCKSVLWSDESNLTFLLEITDAMSSGLKSRETFQRVISVQFSSKSSISDDHQCIRYGQLACLGSHYECSKVYKGLEQHMLPSRRDKQNNA